MLELELLILSLDLAQRLQFGCRRRIHRCTLGHDNALSRESSPTRQHVGMDVKRPGDIADPHAGLMAQTNGRGLEGIAVAMDGSGAWLWHWDTPEG